MPRVNPLRSLANERNVADRVRFEREQRGWTYDGLAKRMANAGFPIQSSAIFKIEKGNPPRRVTVDELVGLAAVFGVGVEELLIPVELVHDRALRTLVERFGECRGQLEQSVIDLRDVLAEIRVLMASPGPRRQIVKTLLDHARKIATHNGGPTWADLKAAQAAVRDTRPYPEYVGDAVERLAEAVERWAREPADEGGS